MRKLRPKVFSLVKQSRFLARKGWSESVSEQMPRLSVSFAHSLPVFPPCWTTLRLRKEQKKERELTDVALADQSHEVSGRQFFFFWIVPGKGWKISGGVWYHFQLVWGPCLSKKAVLFGNVPWQRLANCHCWCLLCMFSVRFNGASVHCLFVCLLWY